MCFNFGNNLCNSNKTFNYFIIIIIKIIIDYYINIFLFCKLDFFLSFLKLGNKSTLNEFINILYKSIFLFCYNKIIVNFSVLFNLLDTRFKNKILNKEINGLFSISLLVLAIFIQYFND